MGTIQHRGMIITGSDDGEVEKLRDAVIAVYAADPDPMERGTHPVTNIFQGINGYRSFAILPRGSKLGWAPADTHDAALELADESVQKSQRLKAARVGYGEIGTEVGFPHAYDDDPPFVRKNGPTTPGDKNGP